MKRTLILKEKQALGPHINNRKEVRVFTQHRLNPLFTVAIIFTAYFPLSIILAMPLREGIVVPKTLLEEKLTLGIDVAIEPVRDRGMKGVYNSPGDVKLLVSGVKRFPVVLIKYPDFGNQYLVSDFQQMLFGTWPSGSAKDYYHEVSYNQFTLDGTVYGWYTADNNKAYYGFNNGWVRAAMLAKEAAQKADATINYAPFDNDRDGYVDCLTCVHAGYGYEETGDGTDIWSHAWSFTSAGIGIYTTNDPDPNNPGQYIKINAYVMNPERSNITNVGTMATIGVFVHEWGHALGLPDLYDTDGGGRGLGRWCVMSHGCWGGGIGGNSPWLPVHMCPWAKMELGWLNPTAIRRRDLYSIPQVETNPKAYWLIGRQRTFKEYFLIENRRKTRFDSLLYGQGLLIYHIDDSVIARRRGYNQINAGGRGWKYGVALEQADGLDQLFTGANTGDANDPWPGGLNRTLFDSISTTPNSKTNYPIASPLITGCLVKNIPASASTISCTLASGAVGVFTGGPDAAGYRWIDSDTTGGPIYSWIDISATGTPLGAGDNARYSFTLPFNFNFYGTNYTQVWVSTNGWLSFGADPGTNAWANVAIPNSAAPNRAVFVFWDDLNLVPRDGANIYYQNFGTAPNRYCVITWKDARHKNAPPGYLRPANQLTFQAILYENSRIVLQYKDCAVGDTSYNWGRSATVGIENADGTGGLQYLFNGSPIGNLLASERAIQFIPPAKDVGAVRILAPTGVIDSGAVVTPRAVVQNFGASSETFPIRFTIGTFYTDDTVITLTAGGIDTVDFTPWNAIQIGTHTTRCTTLLASDINPANDLVTDSVSVGPGVGVAEPSDIQVLPQAFALEGNIPNPFISRTVIRYALPKEARVNLRVYNSSGILVRTLKGGTEKAGFYKVIWDGCDEQGKKAPKGVYFYRLEAGEFKATKKMVIGR